MTKNRHSQTRREDRKPLSMFQANVGKIPPVHDCALALADAERYDVVLLQEPWTAHTKTSSMTKTHPAYDTFTPVEFYRQNDDSDALNTLLLWPVPDRCLIAGDFNARHHTWQTSQATNRGQEIADWASRNDLYILNSLGIPIIPHGHTIGLAFTNIPLAEASVDHLATSSDHFTLNLALPDTSPTPMQPGQIHVTTNDELKRCVEIVELGDIEIPLADSTPAELDELASALGNLLTSAAKAASRPTRKGTRSSPW
ncbi:hypothetical protein AU210_012281 [Fusarium oxysporum f. sp. radicis-cucumerinum]|uniref:Endonuclease/exonuclease/phosphatase domain-containing protein n=1 Tax=Fusarium oxysporum f. sp. radicis-cucumerinum TaxID=327505 RepID=A0A2H3G4U2_FUSOX|nr:hypothetical protein AU210_012281 [Fusarium oxysporum f. sp. radicis-cucumerinum]